MVETTECKRYSSCCTIYYCIFERKWRIPWITLPLPYITRTRFSPGTIYYLMNLQSSRLTEITMEAHEGMSEPDAYGRVNEILVFHNTDLLSRREYQGFSKTLTKLFSRRAYFQEEIKWFCNRFSVILQGRQLITFLGITQEFWNLVFHASLKARVKDSKVIRKFARVSRVSSKLFSLVAPLVLTRFLFT